MNANDGQQSNLLRVLAINPGATSTKFGVFEDDAKVFIHTVVHASGDLTSFSRMFDQYQYRLDLIVHTLAGKPQNAGDHRRQGLSRNGG